MLGPRLNVFWARLGAQLAICAQKRCNFVCSSTLSLRFVLSQVFLYSLCPRSSSPCSRIHSIYPSLKFEKWSIILCLSVIFENIVIDLIVAMWQSYRLNWSNIFCPYECRKFSHVKNYQLLGNISLSHFPIQCVCWRAESFAWETAHNMWLHLVDNWVQFVLVVNV